MSSAQSVRSEFSNSGASDRPSAYGIGLAAAACAYVCARMLGCFRAGGAAAVAAAGVIRNSLRFSICILLYSADEAIEQHGQHDQGDRHISPITLAQEREHGEADANHRR